MMESTISVGELDKPLYIEPEPIVPYPHRSKEVTADGFERDQKNLAERVLDRYKAWFADRKIPYGPNNNVLVFENSSVQRASIDYLQDLTMGGMSSPSPFQHRGSQRGYSRGGGSSHKIGGDKTPFEILSPTLVDAEVTMEDQHKGAIKIEKVNNVIGSPSKKSSAHFLHE